MNPDVSTKTEEHQQQTARSIGTPFSVSPRFGRQQGAHSLGHLSFRTQGIFTRLVTRLTEQVRDKSQLSQSDASLGDAGMTQRATVVVVCAKRKSAAAAGQLATAAATAGA